MIKKDEKYEKIKLTIGHNFQISLKTSLKLNSIVWAQSAKILMTALNHFVKDHYQGFANNQIVNSV